MSAPNQTSAPPAIEVGNNRYDGEIIVMSPAGELRASASYDALGVHDALDCDARLQDAAADWGHLEGEADQLRTAVADLHGQAHAGCIRVCTAEPCRSLGLDGIRVEPPLRLAAS